MKTTLMIGGMAMATLMMCGCAALQEIDPETGKSGGQELLEAVATVATDAATGAATGGGVGAGTKVVTGGGLLGLMYILYKLYKRQRARR